MFLYRDEYYNENSDDLARNLQGAGKYAVYDEIMDAVADFDMVNAKLDAVLNQLMTEEF